MSVERLWQAYSDARQLERFGGLETWPAKFTRRDFMVGGLTTTGARFKGVTRHANLLSLEQLVKIGKIEELLGKLQPFVGTLTSTVRQARCQLKQ